MKFHASFSFKIIPLIFVTSENQKSFLRKHIHLPMNFHLPLTHQKATC